MNFELDQDQQMLADSLRRLLADRYDFEARKRIIASDDGYSPEIWAAFAETGLLGLPLPESVGGFGGGAVALMSVMEALGEYLVVEPYLPTVLASRLIAARGSAAQHEALLGPVMAGELKLALAHGEPAARYETAQVDTVAERAGDGWRLTGTKQLVFGAPMADRIVVSARTSGAGNDAEGISLFVLDPAAAGVRLSRYRTLDNQRAADIQLDGVTLSNEALLGDAGDALADIEATLDFANAMLCAEACGAIRSANADTLEYLKTRKQFGVVIGSFQALQHRMVDMFVTQEQMRSMQYLVCSRLDTSDDPLERARMASAAKIKTGESCRQISQESVQLHGGMGMTEELKVSHTFRRLTVIGQQFGDVDYHLARYARLQDMATA